VALEVLCIHLGAHYLELDVFCLDVLAPSNCRISLVVDSGQTSLQLRHLLAELAFLLTELLQLAGRAYS